MVIFDCNGVLDDRFHETHPIGCHHSSLVNLACRSYILVIRSWSAYDSNHGSARLVDSEPIASVVLASAFSRVGVTLTPETVAREFHGRRTADIFAAVEKTTKRSLPPNFAATVAAETLRRFREELQPIPHAAHALTWIRGPKAVASSSAPDRIRTSLEVTGLMRFFESRLLSASHVADGKPAPDLFLAVAIQLEVAPADCIVVEDSVPGIAAAKASGMTPIGFIGSPHAGGRMGPELMAAGARTVIADMRALASTIIELRGW